MKKIILSMLCGAGLCLTSHAQVLNKSEILHRFDFWANQDWNWYEQNIPFLETPDKDIDLTYYYRWELLTMRLVYGSPEAGYVSTEFIDRPWWSGDFGTISCAVGHHLYDYRWLRNSRYFNDYARFWFTSPGAQPQNYSNWLGDAIWQGYKVKKEKDFTFGLLDGLIQDYRKWEELYWVPEEGMFAWDGMHDGMETNINSRQTENWFSGAPGYRPTLNSYQWAHANAIAHIASLQGKTDIAKQYAEKAALIKKNFQSKCWDPKRHFFFHRFQNDEIAENKKDTIRANTLTYQTGTYAGNPHGRELIGYIPWYFCMIDDTEEFATAWQYLMDNDYFNASHGFTVTERHDPLFHISKNCCAWSGNSWPFGTTQTLKAMSNVLNYYTHQGITRDDFFHAFRTFALAHRKDGKPYIAEALHPDNGSWDGHDVKGHSEHYYHSSYIDLVIADLIGIKPQASDSILVSPLTPKEWDYFVLEDVAYHGHTLTILWDKTGERYHQGPGFRIMADGKTIARAEQVQPLKAYLPHRAIPTQEPAWINYAVNNPVNSTERYYPAAIASFPGILHPVEQLNDGQFWYTLPTTNQWSNEYADKKEAWAGIDFGIAREIEKIILYFADNRENIKAPKSYKLQYWDGNRWKNIPGQTRQYKKPEARKGNAITFRKLTTEKIRVVLTPQKGHCVGLSEIETWGIGKLPLAQPADPDLRPTGIQAIRSSYTSPFDDIKAAVDGKTDPNGRWTNYDSPNQEDWIEIEMNSPIRTDHTYIYFYEDPNITVPEKTQIQYWNGHDWQNVQIRKTIPEEPLGKALYIINYDPVESLKFRVSVSPKPGKYCGIYEVRFQ